MQMKFVQLSWKCRCYNLSIFGAFLFDSEQFWVVTWKRSHYIYICVDQKATRTSIFLNTWGRSEEVCVLWLKAQEQIPHLRRDYFVNGLLQFYNIEECNHAGLLENLVVSRTNSRKKVQNFWPADHVRWLIVSIHFNYGTHSGRVSWMWNIPDVSSLCTCVQLLCSICGVYVKVNHWTFHL